MRFTILYVMHSDGMYEWCNVLLILLKKHNNNNKEEEIDTKNVLTSYT